MRDILFRGKCIKRDGWAYGEFHVDDIRRATIETPRYKHTDKSIPRLSLVSLETVGQYTGLTDKNGKKIFEGDYLLATDICGYKYIDKVVYVTKFDFAQFRLEDEDGYGQDFKELNGNYEVIGNVYDDDIEKLKQKYYA